MASITFTIPSVLNAGSGEKKTEIEVSTLSDAFAKISETMGDDFKRRVLNEDGTPRSLINIYINGKNAKFSAGLDTQLSDGDEVYILPAVAGGSDLSEKELDRYSRQVMLEEIGYQGQLKLKQSKVCVVGVGGLGNPIVTRLAAMGVGRLRIVDRDETTVCYVTGNGLKATESIMSVLTKPQVMQADVAKISAVIG